jgi:hypothetical protein
MDIATALCRRVRTSETYGIRASAIFSRTALAGRFYQVKARDPNGHKGKLCIDAYSGRIVKVKG